MRGLQFTRTGLLAATALTCMVAMPANAQSQDTKPSAAETQPDGLVDIVVTANRREESLQKVPVAIYAFGADQIRAAKIEGFEDVVMRIPNFYSDSVSHTQQSIAMRGAGSIDDSPGTDQGVAMFVDDVYIGENSGLDFDFFDIQRIEVLRGPQGTLFGRNVVGGVVNIITQAPPKEQQSSMEIGYGRFDALTLRGMVGGPLIGDSIQGQIAFSVKNSNGFVANATTGNRLQRDDVKSFRAKLRYDDNGPFDATLGVNYMRDNSQGIARKLEGGPIPGIPLSSDRDIANQNLDGGYDRETWGLTLNANYDFGSAVLSSITAYRKGKHLSSVDLDATPIRIAEFDEQRNEISQFSQELRLSGESESLKWVAGVYYLNLDIQRTEELFVQGAPGSYLEVLTEGGSFPEILGQKMRTESFAGFGQATYSVLPTVRATAGIRYTTENKAGNTYCILPGIQCGEVFDVPSSKTWNAFTPKFTLDVDITPEILGYATIARGFKSGGFISGVATAAEAGTFFNPEYAWNYEAGIKARWFDNKVQTNITFYHVDYTDLQVRQFVGVSNNAGNAGKASVNGLEFEFSARPVRGLDLFANYAYTDAKYDSLILEGEDYSGNQMILTPKHAFTIGGSYAVDMANGGSLTVRSDLQYKSTTQLDVSNNPALTANYPGVLNASMTCKMPNGNWELSIFGKNLTNIRTKQTAQDYSAFYLPLDALIAGQTIVATSYNEPATWGVSLRWKM